MIKGVIFDMDGVLVDNSDIHIEAFMIFCARHGLSIKAEALKGLFGMGNDEIMPEVFGRKMTADEIARYAEEKENVYREIFAAKIKPLEGLRSLLSELKKRDIKIAVGSSGMAKNVEFVLEKCGIKEFFDAKANGDMISKAKPDPEVFLLAANLLNLEPSECVVCEDSHAGIKAARSADMKVVAVATTYKRDEHHDYDIIVDDFTQVSAEQIIALGA
ncbi:MAG: HAD family phosphatase [Rikenellaceae bacterium]